jgi:hypothetical protein
MKKGLFIIVAFTCISFSVLFSSCGPPLPGKVVTENRSVTSFNAIMVDAAVNCKVQVEPGAQTSVQIYGPENYNKMIQAEVQDNTLRIYNKEDFRVDWSDEVVVKVTVPSLVSIDMSGAGTTEIKGQISGAKLSTDVSGVGKLAIADVTVDSLDANVSGAGVLRISNGHTKYGSYELSGAGTIDAFGITHDEAAASVSGAGSINVTATQKLSTEISGVGNIRYKGHPNLTSENDGVGAVKDAN